MKSIKYLLTLVICLTMGLSFVSCGDDDDDYDPNAVENYTSKVLDVKGGGPSFDYSSYDQIKHMLNEKYEFVYKHWKNITRDQAIQAFNKEVANLAEELHNNGFYENLKCSKPLVVSFVLQTERTGKTIKISTVSFEEETYIIK